jgi:integrase
MSQGVVSKRYFELTDFYRSDSFAVFPRGFVCIFALDAPTGGSMSKWTEQSAMKLRYDPQLDRGNRGSYYLWEGGTGFGMRLYRSGRRTWVCATTITNRETGKHTSRFFTLGKIPDMSLKSARVASSEKLGQMRSGKDPRQDENEAVELKRQTLVADKLSATTLADALEFYVENRNCAPVSKKDLKSTLKANVPDWMKKRLFDIDPISLQKRYRQVLDRVQNEGAQRDARNAALAPEKRLLVAKPGYYNGIKAALDTVKGVGRVYRYWTKKHAHQLFHAGIRAPECPTIALMDDIEPEVQRVKSIPMLDLHRLVSSCATYPHSPLHPLLVRLLLATGRRVGCLMGVRKEFIRSDRIEIPGHAARTKVRWNKRHLSHMTQVIPRTPEIDAILESLDRVGPDYGDSTIWLFPSATAESGHMEEERSVALALRKHSGVRFTCHQLRHNVATAGEELGYSKSEIRELLGQGEQTVTDRYIDERVKRQRRQLIEIQQKLVEMMADSMERHCRATGPPHCVEEIDHFRDSGVQSL